MLESGETPVLQAGLEHLGGRRTINSVNYEGGEGPGIGFLQEDSRDLKFVNHAMAPEDPESVEELFKLGYQEVEYSFGYGACPDLEDR